MPPKTIRCGVTEAIDELEGFIAENLDNPAVGWPRASPLPIRRDTRERTPGRYGPTPAPSSHERASLATRCCGVPAMTRHVRNTGVFSLSPSARQERHGAFGTIRGAGQLFP
jgi:hypothetical protein